MVGVFPLLPQSSNPSMLFSIVLQTLILLVLVAASHLLSNVLFAFRALFLHKIPQKEVRKIDLATFKGFYAFFAWSTVRTEPYELHTAAQKYLPPASLPPQATPG